MQVASVYVCSGIFDEETDATKDKQITLEKAIGNLQDALKELELQVDDFGNLRIRRYEEE